MKRTVRLGVFESNSSSTHSISIVTEAEYNNWKNGKLIFDTYSNKFVDNPGISEEEKRKAKNQYILEKETYWKEWDELSDEEKEKWYLDHCVRNKYKYKTFNEYMKCEYDLEAYSEYFTTPSGDKMVAFGHYGYDG